MCRIAAITGTDYTPWQKSMLLHELTVLNAAEPYQKDGWGFTDGRIIVKHSGGYNQGTFSWKKKFDPNMIWTSHVRAASLGTSLTVNESHPFSFQSFVASHNGSIQGVSRVTTSENEPDSDSYAAFDLLDLRIRSHLVHGSEVSSYFFNTGVLDQWISSFYKTSVFVFAFMLHNGDLAIVKGSGDRTLFSARVSNGFILNTSPENIITLSLWSDAFNIYGGEISELEELPNDSLTIFSPGNQSFKRRSLEYKMKEPPPRRRLSKAERRALAKTLQTHGSMSHQEFLNLNYMMDNYDD